VLFLEHCVVSRVNSGLLIHHLDDFFGVDMSRSLCGDLMSVFSKVMVELGVPVAVEKTEGPTMVLTFLGLELDSAKMQVRIPMAKIHELTEKISQILSKTKARLRDIQSLIGSLNFCCRAIPAGRPFCRRLINATCGLTKPFHRIRIRRDMKLKLRMWLQFVCK